MAALTASTPTMAIPASSSAPYRRSLPRATSSLGAITPSLLATHHLGSVLLAHGPQAIRHLTAYLVTSLPGFSALSRGKQRRLVVSALESGTGGPAGDVLFEKVGWGRWGAKRVGDDRIAGLGAGDDGGIFLQDGSSADDATSADEDMMDAEGPGDGESRTTSVMDSDDDSDQTDEEDWESMGPEALRLRGGTPLTSASSPGFLAVGGWKRPDMARSPSSQLAMSWGGGHERMVMGAGQAGGLAALRAKEEREAVEALMKLGSV